MTIKQIERLRRLHHFIKTRQTGSPKELAKRLHISERQVYNMIDYLKDTGAEIKYSRSEQTYFYKNDFDILINVSVEIMLKDEVFKIFGGTTRLNDNYLNTELFKNI